MNTLHQLNLVPIYLMQLMILTQKHIFQKEKYLRIEMFQMNDIIVKKTQSKQQVSKHLLGIKKNIT